MEEEFLELSKRRKEEITDPKTFKLYQSKIKGFNTNEQLQMALVKEPSIEYTHELKL